MRKSIRSCARHELGIGHMKNQKLLLTICSVVLFSIVGTSCNKENTTRDLIIGEWISTVGSYIEDDEGDTLHRYDFPAYSFSYDFKKDGTVTFSVLKSNDYMDEGMNTYTYKIVDNHLFFGREKGSWSFGYFDIVEISKKKLVLEEGIEPYANPNGIFHYTIHFEFKNRNN